MTRRLVALGGAVLTVVMLAGPARAASQAPDAAPCRAAPTVTAAHRPLTDARPAVLPPTPDVLASARTAGVARVTAVLYRGPRPAAPHRPANFVGPVPPLRCQVVRLAVVRTLEGAPGTTLVVVKPEAPYTLAASRRVQAGTFLLDGATPYPTILGNYGPASYDPAAVATALASG
ncbi:MAG TPA: hypothetical protein VI462_17180 [Acidimicrobiia bacterium]